MSSGEVDLVKELFCECYKIIENMHSLGKLFCHCYRCHGCPSLKNFLKEEKRYCSICVFQDSFNLWELNEIKRDRVKLNNYYSEILKVCCEAKKTCAFEENFWERDIHFVVKNDGVYTYFNEMKDFLFNL